jgi:hypothetical protein
MSPCGASSGISIKAFSALCALERPRALHVTRRNPGEEISLLHMRLAGRSSDDASMECVGVVVETVLIADALTSWQSMVCSILAGKVGAGRAFC